MLEKMDNRIIDTGVFLIANFFNLIMTVIFIFRVKKKKRVEYILGLILTILAIPLLVAVIFNIINKRDFWFVLLPIIFFFFLVLEFILDYVLKLNFRETFLLWPYLLVYYVSLMGMIGYSFMINRTYGFITLITYFLQLFATWYSYSKVKHG